MEINLHEDDKVILDINMVPILDPERMKDVLKNELEKNGFEIEGNKATKENPNGSDYEIDLDELKLEIDVSKALQEKKSEIYMEEEDLPDELIQGGKDEIEIDVNLVDDEVRKSIENAVNRNNSKTNQAVTQETLKGRQLINEILRDVYREAVKEKANSMGNVSSMNETNENGEMKIRVEIE